MLFILFGADVAVFLGRTRNDCRLARQSIAPIGTLPHKGGVWMRGNKIAGFSLEIRAIGG